MSVLVADCREALKTLPDKMVASAVTDPPYELSYGARKWDGSGVAYDEGLWREVLRVLKPGAHLLAFGGTRTYHRLTAAIEIAGFEVRDSIHWVYGSGFPKSLNLSGKQEGWGTALKPAHEPIVVARKPLAGTVSETVEAFGTGGLNIEGSRVNGRWPPNFVLSHTPNCDMGACDPTCAANEMSAQQATALDFFPAFRYQAKPSRDEKDAGLDSLPLRSGGEATERKDGSAGLRDPRAGAGRKGGVKNVHPTVKPVELLRWLCRLVTPEGGTVLDPFAGSGTTGVAAVLEGFEFIGIEQEAEYAQIAELRMAYARNQAANKPLTLFDGGQT